MSDDTYSEIPPFPPSPYRPARSQCVFSHLLQNLYYCLYICVIIWFKSVSSGRVQFLRAKFLCILFIIVFLAPTSFPGSFNTYWVNESQFYFYYTSDFRVTCMKSSLPYALFNSPIWWWSSIWGKNRISSYLFLFCKSHLKNPPFFHKSIKPIVLNILSIFDGT